MYNNEKSMNFVEIQDEEMYEINGGISWSTVALIAGAVVLFGIGFYNGYNDTIDQKK